MRFKDTYMKLMNEDRYDSIPAIFKKPTEQDAKIRYFEKISKMNIFDAVIEGNYCRVNELIEQGADVNMSNPKDFNYTPLHYAAQYGHNHIAELLLKHGADPDIRKYWTDKPVLTPFLIARDHKNFDVANTIKHYYMLGAKL